MGWTHCFRRADLRRVSRGFLQWKRVILRDVWKDSFALDRRRQALGVAFSRIARMQKTMALKQWCTFSDQGKRAEIAHQRACRMWARHTLSTAIHRWRSWNVDVCRLRKVSEKICQRRACNAIPPKKQQLTRSDLQPV